MKINSDDLKRLFRSFIRDRIPRSDESCPSPEIISNLFFQPSAEDHKAKIIDHISQCSRCHEIFEFCLGMSRSENWLAAEIETHSKQAKKKRLLIFNLPRHPAMRPSWKPIFIPIAAAVLITMAILTTRFITGNKNRDDRGRSPSAVYLLSPTSGLPSKLPLIFRWSTVKETQFVLLDIFDEALLPIWKSSRISGESYELPPEVREKIDMGKTYFWMITAFFSDGTEVESELKKFSIRE